MKNVVFSTSGAAASQSGAMKTDFKNGTSPKCTRCSGNRMLFFLFLFLTDALFAQVEFDEWLQKNDHAYSQFQNSMYEDWSRMKREKYAQWKEQKLKNSQTGDEYITEGSEDISNTSSTGAVSQQPLPHTPAAKTWVIIVGIAEYNLSMLRLNFTKDDAYRMYAFYKSVKGGSLPDRQITLLLDINATRSNVINALENTYAKADKDDAIIFYFAGHGTPGMFLLYEFDEDEEMEGVLKHEELNQAFMQSQAKYKYIIADACHSGSLAEYSAQREAENRSAYQSFEDSEKGFVMMLSSMGKEVSVEDDGIRQGIFSYNLIKGMKGSADMNKDGIVSVIELFDYVDAEVRTATNGQQNPVLAGDYDDLYLC